MLEGVVIVDDCTDSFDFTSNVEVSLEKKNRRFHYTYETLGGSVSVIINVMTKEKFYKRYFYANNGEKREERDYGDFIILHRDVKNADLFFTGREPNPVTHNTYQSGIRIEWDPVFFDDDNSSSHTNIRHNPVDCCIRPICGGSFKSRITPIISYLIRKCENEASKPVLSNTLKTVLFFTSVLVTYTYGCFNVILNYYK